MSTMETPSLDAGTTGSGGSTPSFPRPCRFCGTVLESRDLAMAHLASSNDCARKANMAAVVMRMGLAIGFEEKNAIKICQDMGEFIANEHPELCPPPNARGQSREPGAGHE